LLSGGKCLCDDIGKLYHTGFPPLDDPIHTALIFTVFLEILANLLGGFGSAKVFPLPVMSLEDIQIFVFVGFVYGGVGHGSVFVGYEISLG
jgi:hypothetical protein